MPNEQFTPAPWTLEESQIAAPSFDVFGAGDEWIATVHSGIDADAANAHLILAAPEMYAALKQADAWLAGWESAKPQLATIRAVLAKAEGWRL